MNRSRLFVPSRPSHAFDQAIDFIAVPLPGVAGSRQAAVTGIRQARQWNSDRVCPGIDAADLCPTAQIAAGHTSSANEVASAADLTFTQPSQPDSLVVRLPRKQAACWSILTIKRARELMASGWPDENTNRVVSKVPNQTVSSVLRKTLGKRFRAAQSSTYIGESPACAAGLGASVVASARPEASAYGSQKIVDSSRHSGAPQALKSQRFVISHDQRDCAFKFTSSFF